MGVAVTFLREGTLCGVTGIPVDVAVPSWRVSVPAISPGIQQLGVGTGRGAGRPWGHKHVFQMRGTGAGGTLRLISRCPQGTQAQVDASVHTFSLVTHQRVSSVLI